MPGAPPASVVDLGDEIAHQTLAMLIGSLTIAIPMAALGYFLFLGLGRVLDLHPSGHRSGKRSQTTAEDRPNE